MKRYGKDPKSRQRRIALERAPDYARVLRETVFTFPNLKITLRNVGLVAPGFSTWVDSPEWKLEKIPHELQGATLVDNLSIPARNFLLNSELIRQDSEARERIRNGNPAGSITVLPRRDLNVYLFSESIVSGPFLQPTSFEISLRDTKGRFLNLVGTKVMDYSELARASIKGRAFFVISPKPVEL